MAAVDALSLSDGGTGGFPKRWAIGLAFALALHAGAIWLLRETPEPEASTELPAIEMDMSPPPGAAAPELPPSDASRETLPEETRDLPPDETKQSPPDETEPPPDTQAIDETPPEETRTLDQLTAPTVQNLPQDAVTLPPDDAVVAQDETPPPPQVVKRPPPRKPEPKKEVAKRETKPKETRPDAKKEAAPPPAARAGGAGGAGAASAAGSSAAAANYASLLGRLVAAQKRYPAMAQAQKLSGRGVISFTVSRSGAVIRQSISSTGSPILDQALRDMLARASGSFPPMPPEVPGATKNFTVPVSFSFRR